MTIIERLTNYVENKRASDAEVARLTGMSIPEYDADTTAPDPAFVYYDGNELVAEANTEEGAATAPADEDLAGKGGDR